MYKYVLYKISAVSSRNLSVFSDLEYVKTNMYAHIYFIELYKLQSIFKYVISFNGHITNKRKVALFPSSVEEVSGFERLDDLLKDKCLRSDKEGTFIILTLRYIY